MRKFNGFYEDEESRKMMDLINESANKEYERRKAIAKKEKHQDLFLKIFIFLTLGFMLYCAIKVSNTNFKNNVERCVAKGEEKSICEYKFSK